MTIAAILKHKGHDIAAVAPTNSIAEVARVLAERRIGAVLVHDATARVIGILSERDVVRALARHGEATLNMTAAQIMTANVRTATPATSVHEAMEMMTDGRFRHLPVLDHGDVVGIVSIGDIVKARIMAAEQDIDSLKAYVAGG